MSGPWAREADAVLLCDWERLDKAAQALTTALTLNGRGRDFWLNNASAIIRRERKRLDPKGDTTLRRDWPDGFSDENLIWAALRLVATVDASARDENRAWHLRLAEAALRTLHKRGQS